MNESTGTSEDELLAKEIYYGLYEEGKQFLDEAVLHGLLTCMFDKTTDEIDKFLSVPPRDDDLTNIGVALLITDITYGIGAAILALVGVAFPPIAVILVPSIFIVLSLVSFGLMKVSDIINDSNEIPLTDEYINASGFGTGKVYNNRKKRFPKFCKGYEDVFNKHKIVINKIEKANNNKETNKDEIVKLELEKKYYESLMDFDFNKILRITMYLEEDNRKKEEIAAKIIKDARNRDYQARNVNSKYKQLNETKLLKNLTPNSAIQPLLEEAAANLKRLPPPTKWTWDE